VPEAEGEVGSQAAVRFTAQASVRTVATLPRLQLLVESQPDVLIGGRQGVTVTVSNVGTGVARAVRLEADVPDLLRHESGESQLEAVLGDLRPNEQRRIRLDLAAVQPGRGVCMVRATSEDGVSAEESLDVDVRAPELTAAIDGPHIRYLDRQAT